jgi:hypothetical protein
MYAVWEAGGERRWGRVRVCVVASLQECFGLAHHRAPFPAFPLPMAMCNRKARRAVACQRAGRLCNWRVCVRVCVCVCVLLLLLPPPRNHPPPSNAHHPAAGLLIFDAPRIPSLEPPYLVTATTAGKPQPSLHVPLSCLEQAMAGPPPSTVSTCAALMHALSTHPSPFEDAALQATLDASLTTTLATVASSLYCDFPPVSVAGVVSVAAHTTRQSVSSPAFSEGADGAGAGAGAGAGVGVGERRRRRSGASHRPPHPLPTTLFGYAGQYDNSNVMDVPSPLMTGLREAQALTPPLGAEINSITALTSASGTMHASGPSASSVLFSMLPISTAASVTHAHDGIPTSSPAHHDFAAPGPAGGLLARSAIDAVSPRRARYRSVSASESMLQAVSAAATSVIGALAADAVLAAQPSSTSRLTAIRPRAATSGAPTTLLPPELLKGLLAAVSGTVASEPFMDSASHTAPASMPVTTGLPAYAPTHPVRPLTVHAAATFRGGPLLMDLSSRTPSGPSGGQPPRSSQAAQSSAAAGTSAPGVLGRGGGNSKNDANERIHMVPNVSPPGPTLPRTSAGRGRGTQSGESARDKRTASPSVPVSEAGTRGGGGAGGAAAADASGAPAGGATASGATAGATAGGAAGGAAGGGGGSGGGGGHSSTSRRGGRGRIRAKTGDPTIPGANHPRALSLAAASLTPAMLHAASMQLPRLRGGKDFWMYHARDMVCGCVCVHACA